MQKTHGEGTQSMTRGYARVCGKYVNLVEPHRWPKLLAALRKRPPNFLDTDFEAAKPATFKQANQPLLQMISNYSELKERFTGTPWEAFFED
jgi:hypothetical protein